MTDRFELNPIGVVRSSLRDPAKAPRQADEGAPSAAIHLCPEVSPAANDIKPGDEVLILTWLHLADRDVLSVHPRDDESRPQVGVFSTRSQDRPNPIGIHQATVVGVMPGLIELDALEAIDGTPVIDIKPVLQPPTER